MSVLRFSLYSVLFPSGKLLLTIWLIKDLFFNMLKYHLTNLINCLRKKNRIFLKAKWSALNQQLSYKQLKFHKLANWFSDLWTAKRHKQKTVRDDNDFLRFEYCRLGLKRTYTLKKKTSIYWKYTARIRGISTRMYNNHLNIKLFSYIVTVKEIIFSPLSNTW